ncbi:hypothetical protein EXU85_20595 [Spirosoma sp. KCTC 42546]|uniref:LexA family transcriptional regulator n=1 Tax=Spirosoma sp. KCTC 42546 TaxID=2520506 RepID=UPI001156CDA7|nr:S24 family peptidase [Spirosoma sp. KCTC 42546]QDK80880.1 hypothetical protein EXU85_20595 [Spirosoma sp. KCTC 42546]
MMIDSVAIQRLYKKKGYKQETFAAKIGISPRKFFDILKKGEVKKEADLQAMADALEVDVNMIRSKLGDQEPGIFTEGNVGSVRPNLNEYYKPVKLLSARAQMGMPLMTHETFNLNWLEETYPVFMPTIAISEKHLVIEVVGDSMVPEIKDRALVLAEAVNTNDIKYQSGAVYAVLYAGNHFVVKRIKSNDLNVNSTITLWSDNERYGNIIIHGEDIIHMWKVIEKVKEPVR